MLSSVLGAGEGEGKHREWIRGVEEVEREREREGRGKGRGEEEVERERERRRGGREGGEGDRYDYFSF